jgi:hypothetical protein
MQGQYEFVLFVPPIKSSKSEVFTSFFMEFKLKTSENYLKSIKKLGTVRLIPSKIADFHQIKQKNTGAVRLAPSKIEL